MNRELFSASSLLAGTILGAGIFSLPFVVGQLGFALGLFYFLVFGAVYAVLHLMFARLIMKEGPGHNFLHLTEKFFPRPFKIFADLIIIGETIFTLLVYLILVPAFVRLVFPVSDLWIVLAFWVAGSAFIFVKLGWLGWTEFLDVLCVLAIIAAILFLGGLHFENIPLFASAGQSVPFAWLLPLGPFFFALYGRSAITKMIEIHGKAVAAGREFLLEKAVWWGTFVPVALYIGFTAVVLAFNPNVGPDTISSLSGLSPLLSAVLALAGFITLWTSYFMIGLNLKDILVQDLRWSRVLSACAVVILPIALYLIGLRNFLEAIGIAGGFFLALESIFIVAMWRKAFPENRGRKFSPMLYLVFLAAIAYQIVNFL
ncbi:MAG: aromatic amino acid transport family protein [Patescibacteria group bacterium]